MKSNRPKRPTLQDVADQVGVTKMTVSRYLRDAASVSATTQKKIQQALDSLGYIPNRAPDILSNSKSHAIGVLVPSLTNHVFSEVIRGIEAITEPAGYQTMLAHYGYSSAVEEERVASLLSYNVDGLILSESVHTERTLKMVETAGIPVVEIMDTSAHGFEQCIGFNNIEAAKTMVEAMLTRGHRHIVYLGARMDVRTRLKLQGFEQAMTAAGLPARSMTTEAASSFSLGSELLLRALDRYPQIDGIFCTNDDLAIGALFECQRQGVLVPDDIAIAGFHGHDISQAITPKLASVITPRKEIGKVAATALLQRCQGEPIANEIIDLGFTVEAGGTI